MARLKHIKTGAIVSVTDEKAARMGDEWRPVREQAEPAPTRRSKKSATK